jgi:predicted MFS family arabinose efflux permease
MNHNIQITSPDNSQPPIRLTLIVAVAIGLSIMGDSLMYSLLPLEASSLGIALPLVGVLLSANRLVRLFSNTWISAVFKRFGPRLPFLIATILALLTTRLYGIGWGVWIFLLARIGWGIAWSSLRQGGYEAVGLADDALKGRLMGVLWGVVRLGSAFSVSVGGYLRDRFSYRSSVSVISIFTALAIPLVAFGVRWPSTPVEGQEKKPPPLLTGWRMSQNTPAQRWILIVGFLDAALEGILVSTVALFLTRQLDDSNRLALFGMGMGTTTGLLLSVRFLADLLFGPLLGALADKLGKPTTAFLLAAILLAGLIGAVKSPDVGIVFFLALVFICRSGLFVTLSAAASSAAARAKLPHLFVGVYTTSADAGLAVGPLLAYSLSGAISLPSLYVAGGSLLLAAVWRFWQVERQRNQFTISD